MQQRPTISQRSPRRPRRGAGERPRRALAPLCLLVAGIGQPAIAGGDPEFVADRVIVRLVPGAQIGPLNSQHGTTTAASVPEHNLFVIQLPPQINEHALVQLLAVNQAVEWVEFNATIGVTGGSTQSFFLGVSEFEYHEQYAWDLLGLDDASLTATGEGVTVAVLDTGIDASHPLLEGRILTEDGYNFVDHSADTTAALTARGAAPGMAPHGTFTAGLILSLAPQANILPVTVLDDSGAGDAFHVAAGILYAIDHGAQIINLGLGTPIESLVLDHAVSEAAAAGVLVIAAAGNRDQDQPAEYPAAYPDAMAIASTDQGDLKSQFSNYGLHIELSAPGSQIISAVPGGGYAVSDGSSLSTALVSGAAALLKSHQPQSTPDEVRESLAAAALDIDPINPGHAGLLGAGRLEILAALQDPAADPGDLTGDGVVTIEDVLTLLAAWGPCEDPPDCRADFNGDHVVDLDDLLILLANWD